MAKQTADVEPMVEAVVTVKVSKLLYYDAVKNWLTSPEGNLDASEVKEVSTQYMAVTMSRTLAGMMLEEFGKRAAGFAIGEEPYDSGSKKENKRLAKLYTSGVKRLNREIAASQ